MPDDTKQVAATKLLLARFQERFGVTALCPFFFHQDYPCILGLETQPDGPFVGGNLGIFVPAAADTFFPISQWFMQQVPALNLSLFVHPNSGWEGWDHAQWSLFSQGGERWPLNTDIFLPGPDPPNSTWPIHHHNVSSAPVRTAHDSSLVGTKFSAR